jgi:hypothetical protein
MEAQPEPNPVPATPADLAEHIAAAEASLAISELFYESIVNREAEAIECASGPDREVLPPNEPTTQTTEEGASTADGWDLGDDVVTLDENPATETPPDSGPSPDVPATTPTQPEPRPSADDEITASRGSFARCDFVSALAFARRAQALDPGHPWLAANLPRIERLAEQQRLTNQNLMRARSLSSSGDLDGARGALRAAAALAPGCMSDPIARVDSQIATAIADRRQRGREAFAQGLATLIEGIGTAVAAASPESAPAFVPRSPTGTATPGLSPSGGGAANGVDCYAFDSRPFLQPIASQAGPDDKILWYVEHYRMPEGSTYTVSAAGSEGAAMAHAQIDAAVRRSRPGVTSNRSGPYGSLAAAWAAVTSRCGNILTFQ